MDNTPKIEVKLGRRPGSLTILVDGKPCEHRDRNRLIRKWVHRLLVGYDGIEEIPPMGDPDVD